MKITGNLCPLDATVPLSDSTNQHKITHSAPFHHTPSLPPSPPCFFRKILKWGKAYLISLDAGKNAGVEERKKHKQSHSSILMPIHLHFQHVDCCSPLLDVASLMTIMLTGMPVGLVGSISNVHHFHFV